MFSLIRDRERNQDPLFRIVLFQFPVPVSVPCSLNKKVLLRERKRHTDRRLASTPSVVLTGGGGGYPITGQGGIRIQGTPRIQGWMGVPPVQGWMGVPPHLDLAGVPPPRRCGQTENITFPHPSDAVGNKLVLSDSRWVDARPPATHSLTVVTKHIHLKIGRVTPHFPRDLSQDSV